MNKIPSNLLTNMFSGQPLNIGDRIEFHRAQYEKGTVFQDEMVEDKFSELIDVLGDYANYSLSQPFCKNAAGLIITIEEIIKPGIFIKG